MKILLLGEFSGLYRGLKAGLVSYGHDVITASAGDYWKEISADIAWAPNSSNLVEKVFNSARLAGLARKLTGFDVVQVVHSTIFPHFNNALLNFVINNNEQVYLSAAGNDPISIDFFKNSNTFRAFYDAIQRESNGSMYFERPDVIERHFRTIERVRGVIPIMYEYAEAYRSAGVSKLCETIPIATPTKIASTESSAPCEDGKLHLFHGINRFYEKGSNLILPILQEYSEKYPNRLVLNVPRRISFERYTASMLKADVVIDQLHMLSYGVNAVLAMSAGKVHMGGGDSKECRKEFGVEECPVLTINSDPNTIRSAIEELMDPGFALVDRKLASLQYVRDVHDPRKVARSYLETWGNRCD